MNLGGGAAIGLVFGLLAAVCAYVIAYSEYKRNWTFTGNAVHMALRTAAVTFVIFFLAGLLLPFLFQQLGFGG